MSGLRSCPFCGSNDLQDMWGYINCENCDADGPTGGDYTDDWNKRAHPTCTTCRHYDQGTCCEVGEYGRHTVEGGFYCAHHKTEEVGE